MRATLGNKQVPLDRQAVEIWKSAAADKDAMLAAHMSGPAIHNAANIAAASTDPHQATRLYENALNDHQAYGLVCDIAKRALLRATSAKTGAEGFAQELFAEAANYYISRDLPSFVAASGRASTTTEALAVKDGIRSLTRRVIAPLTDRISENVHANGALDVNTWRNFVADAFKALSRSEEQ